MPKFALPKLSAVLGLAILAVSPAGAAPLLQLVTENEVLTFADTDVEHAAIEGAQLDLEITPSARARLFEFTSNRLESEVLLIVCWSTVQSLTVREPIDSSQLSIALSDDPGDTSSTDKSDGSYCDAFGF